MVKVDQWEVVILSRSVKVLLEVIIDFENCLSASEPCDILSILYS